MDDERLLPSEKRCEATKAKFSHVPKHFIHGQDNYQADPRGRPQGVRQGQAPIKLLRQEGGVCPPTGGRLGRPLACQLWSYTPPYHTLGL